MDFSAYHFYGVHVPSEQWAKGYYAWSEGERLDPIIKDLGLGDGSVSVGYLCAGDYDRNMLFLCVDIQGLGFEVRLGEYRVSPQLPAEVNWNMALRMVADTAGYTGLADPAWITVPDLS
jgi:hypothetical protein